MLQTSPFFDIQLILSNPADGIVRKLNLDVPN